MALLLTEIPKDLLAQRASDSDRFTIDKPQRGAIFLSWSRYAA
jgi:hypothetical protein